MAKETLESLSKQVSEDLVDNTKSASDIEVAAYIVKFTKEVEDQIQAKKDNTKIAELTANRKALTDGYNNVIKEYRKKIKYLMLLLESRGKL